MLVPPFYQCGIVGSRVSNLPIKLWHTIVYPSIVDPSQHIGIKVVVVLQAVSLGTIQRVALLVAINTEWRHTKLHPWLSFVDRLAKLLYEEVDIISAPVATISDTIIIFSIFSIVGNNHSRSWVWIEIVVDVQTVNIITAHDVVNHLVDIVSILRHTRI